MDENQLIAALPRTDRERLLAICRPLELQAGQVLCDLGQPLQQLVFPISGTLVLMAQVDEDSMIAVALIGSEGVLGAQALLWPSLHPPTQVDGAAESPNAAVRAQVQTPGDAWQADSADLRRLLAGSGALRGLFARQLLGMLMTLATAAACAHFHQIGPRLARWLLLCQDRAGVDSFQLTQAQLAVLLGVRRVGITVAAGVLQRGGLIGYHRGCVQVLDRPGLEAAACGCRAADALAAAMAA